MLSIRPEESVAIIETEGLLAAARLGQVLGQETAARIVAVSPMNASGRITTVIAGQISEVRYALEVISMHKLASDHGFFARPNVQMLDMLLASQFSGAQATPTREATRPKREEALPLFSQEREEETPAQSPTPRQAPVPRQSSPKPQAAAAPRAAQATQSKPLPPVSAPAHRDNDDSAEAFERKPLSELQDYTVHELRRYSRAMPNFPIAGRAISRANKSELLQMIKSTEEKFATLDAQQSALVRTNGAIMMN